ncbi:MAG: flagellar basal body L-ring protein [Rhodobacteraceae bacterium]|nr:flagellar basal body L-ring protein [Paracoccaceae bacterium]
MRRLLWCAGLLVAALSGCDTDLSGKPNFTPVEDGDEQVAMRWPGLPMYAEPNRTVDGASLWSGSRQSLLGDRRAVTKGDILTVVIEIDESAEISNDTSRERTGSESLSVPGLFGLPQRINENLPEGATLDDAVSIASSGSSAGKGSVKRNEKLELRVAATIVDVLPNGVLEIEGTQQVRVNFELRELLVAGYVRPTDISRQNEITYDKIAAARISYGGRGQITAVQQPRYGQRALDYVLPF